MKSLGFSEEHSNDGYRKCNTCKTPTILLTTGCIRWSPDEEPYKNGEQTEGIEDAKLKKFVEKLADEGIELGEEITIHYCPECEKITSINVNWEL